MSWPLAMTAVLMGLAGGPHCLGMCGAACAGLGQAGGRHGRRAVLAFQIGRILGYSLLGALLALTVQSLSWLSAHSAALRPWWTLLHLMALCWGILLLVRARQPLWVDQRAQTLWRWLRQRAASRTGPVVLGLMWAMLPCGLLYSALMVAALAGSAWGGAVTMALFAASSAAWLLVGPWLWLRLLEWREQRGAGSARGAVRGDWGVRLAGAALAGSAAWALLDGTVLGRAMIAWCVS